MKTTHFLAYVKKNEYLCTSNCFFAEKHPESINKIKIS
jgi:hypothetical protein